MMNRTAAVFFLFSRRPGEYLPLFWLAGAFVLGFLWSLAYASGLVAEEPLPWPAGRLMFAFYGMLVYGWALPVLFSFAAGSRSRWMKPAEWLWHACVALGLATIAAGNGSGVLLMPFDWWVCPVFAFLAAGAACVAWFRPFPWPVRLLFSSSAGCVAAALWALGYTQALSMNGLLDVSALGGSLSCGLMFAALGAAALRLDMAQGRAAGILSVWMALVLAAAPVIGGLGGLQGFPVPWMLVEAGTVWFWCAVLPAVLAVARFWIKSGTKTGIWVKTGVSLLALLAAWNVFVVGAPELMQFSLSAWHEPELWILLGAGVLMMAGGKAPGRFPVAWRLLGAGVCGVLLAYAVGVLAALDVQAFPEARRAELMSGWVGMAACVHAAAMAFCLAGSLCLWRPAGVEDGGREPSPPFLRRFFFISAVAAALALATAAAVFLHAPPPDSMEVRRPVHDAEGSGIYAAEGCALCHTQIIRRSLSGKDWQTAIDRGTDPDFPYRVSEPEDMDAEFNREGAPQAGVAAIGPDLSNAAEYAAGRLEYEDAVSGGTRRAAQAREWLALHLYNPREMQFNKPWTVCPSMPGLFEERTVEGNAPSTAALPVRMERGRELVPSPRGERLLNYLESLRREEPSLKRDQIHSFPALSHIHPDYAAHPPAVDMERLKKARAAAVMEKGRGVYLSKCAICHGNDGMGDKVTYPPLAGSEWLKEKPDAEIVKIILQGLTGPITVNGKEWDSTMLPPGVTDSRDLANLLTFLRRQFGGVEKAAYTPEQVDAIRRDL